MAKWIIAVFVVSSSAASADTYLNLYGFAYHPDDSKTCAPDNSVCSRPNERNYGLGVRHSLESVDIGAGAFKDSFDDWSYYVGIEKQWHIIGPIYGGGQVFVMGRKTFRSYSPFLGVLPVASIRIGDYSLNVSYVPEFEAWKMREVFFFYASVRL